jgi:hypothetical protein
MLHGPPGLPGVQSRSADGTVCAGCGTRAAAGTSGRGWSRCDTAYSRLAAIAALCRLQALESGPPCVEPPAAVATRWCSRVAPTARAWLASPIATPRADGTARARHSAVMTRWPGSTLPWPGRHEARLSCNRDAPPSPTPPKNGLPLIGRGQARVGLAASPAGGGLQPADARIQRRTPKPPSAPGPVAGGVLVDEGGFKSEVQLRGLRMLVSPQSTLRCWPTLWPLDASSGLCPHLLGGGGADGTAQACLAAMRPPAAHPWAANRGLPTAVAGGQWTARSVLVSTRTR